MKEIVFASGNQNKVAEIALKLGGNILVKGLSYINCPADLPETSDTLEGNARQKARYVWEHYGVSCFADDTGLEVDALGGLPGVLSARFAGEGKKSSDNIAKLLDRMSSELIRTAHFRTVICCILDGNEYLFEGKCEGHITRELRGEDGFGYDPVFVPENNSRSFSEMSTFEKNALSHRGKAVEKLKIFLGTQN